MFGGVDSFLEPGSDALEHVYTDAHMVGQERLHMLRASDCNDLIMQTHEAILGHNLQASALLLAAGCPEAFDAWPSLAACSGIARFRHRALLLPLKGLSRCRLRIHSCLAALIT